tara:strand:- start:166 stop:792 length:627 start_codon:yes stop_codon:yes gene_type:complete
MEQFDLFDTNSLLKDQPKSTIDTQMGYLPFSKDNSTNTVEFAQRRLAAFMDEGTSCPCCGQHVELRDEIMTRTVAEPLIWMTENYASIDWSSGHPIVTESRWVSVAESGPKSFRSARHYTRAKYWGLIEKLETDSIEADLKSGMWRVTQKGVDFVSGRILIPKKAVVYLGKQRGYKGDLIDISQALRREFSLRDSLGPYITKDKHGYT